MTEQRFTVDELRAQFEPFEYEYRGSGIDMHEVDRFLKWIEARQNELRAGMDQGKVEEAVDPPFEHDDDDLRDLMNWSAAMNSSRANMDTSLAFLDALERVEMRLNGWRAAILQSVKPGDVVFIELSKNLSMEDMERIRKQFDTADLGVKIVMLHPDMKLAIPRKPS